MRCMGRQFRFYLANSYGIKWAKDSDEVLMVAALFRPLDVGVREPLRFLLRIDS